MKIQSMQDMLVHELRDLYSAEKQLLKALKQMSKAANSDKLRQLFEKHRTETEGQVERLEKVFDQLKSPARAKKCEAMEGILAEATQLLDGNVAPEVLDAALIGAAQKAEHYEIASYGTVRTWAEQLGKKQITSLLQKTLDEEHGANEKLNELAMSEENAEAVSRQ